MNSKNPGAGPVFVRPAETEFEFDFGMTDKKFERFFHEFFAVEPVVVHAERFDSVGFGESGLAFERFHLREVIIPDVLVRRARLIVSGEARFRLPGIGPFGETFAPPFVVFRKLRSRLPCPIPCSNPESMVPSIRTMSGFPVWNRKSAPSPFIHFFYGAGCLMHQRAEQDGCFAFRGALACSVLEKPVVDDCFEFKQNGPVECENSAQVVECAGCAPGAGVQNLEQIEPVVFHLAAKRLAFVRLSVCGLFFLCDGVLESVDFLLHADHFLFQSVAVSLEFGEGDVLKVVSGSLFGDRQSLPVQRIGHDRPVENS